MKQSMPQVLFICRHGGWTDRAAACFETLLTAGVYEQDAALVLLQDGVTLLMPEQQADALRPKTLAQQLPALELYGIHQVFVEATALAACDIDPATLPLPVTVLAGDQLASLVQSARATLVF